MFDKPILYFSQQPSKLFLLDALGAVLSAFLLGVVMMKYQNYFGMPKEKLAYLALAPCLFAIYSFFCYLRKPKNWRSLLKIIAIANLTYCLITFSLLFIDKEELTTLGYIYFINEIVLVVSLVYVEWKTANKFKQ